MSSDSDDEDELLQMALKEQAQRDLNYQRPPSNTRKPVANFVQQPPPSRPATTTSMANQPKQQKNRSVVEEDDDSEVEMLSISSGDEEVSKDRGRGGTAARGRTGRGGGGGGGRDDDRGWDGEEPDCWKRVDEDELARRVREMRETRTAPVAQKFERKPSTLARKGLNSLQSFPRGMECVDPLGLG